MAFIVFAVKVVAELVVVELVGVARVYVGSLYSLFHSVLYLLEQHWKHKA